MGSIEVSGPPLDGTAEVQLSIYDFEGEVVLKMEREVDLLAMTPAKARELAGKLSACADAIEAPDPGEAC